MTDRVSLQPLKDLSAAIGALVAKTGPSLVAVHSWRSRASGFVWRPHLVVTADESLADEGEITVHLADGTSLPASLVGRDPSTDVALLRVERGDLSPVALESPDIAAGAGGGVGGAAGEGPPGRIGIRCQGGGPLPPRGGGARQARRGVV